MAAQKIIIESFSSAHNNLSLFLQLPALIYGPLAPKQEKFAQNALCCLALLEGKPVARLSLQANDGLKHARALPE